MKVVIITVTTGDVDLVVLYRHNDNLKESIVSKKKGYMCTILALSTVSLYMV